MTPRSPARKVLTVLTALAIGGVALWLAAEVVIISGTKANFTFVEAKSPPGSVTKTTGTTSTTATTAASPRP
ncbi:MAG TPA: hypothetical protein VKD90_05425 [Gemmataceae bacterium]|nr:hypothetical protein [Gemmataceae bacterium]